MLAQDFYHQKKARAIGVSNYCKACFECILPNATVRPMVNQLELHVGMGPGANAYATSLLEYMKDNGVVPMAYSPLGPTFNTSAKDVLIDGKLTTGIGKAHGKSGAQVTSRSVVSVVQFCSC